MREHLFTFLESKGFQVDSLTYDGGMACIYKDSSSEGLKLYNEDPFKFLLEASDYVTKQSEITSFILVN